MASPRVFISSTCFDLAEVRDSLTAFCQGFGFEVVMSDKGDVFYHPDLHTHESCVSEISNCQLFILIIGGRFGGRYKVDPSKSITNAEYIAAKELGIPVFTFVKEGVLADHHVYQKNKNKEFSGEIEYPSIENQQYAENIFRFIDSVRGSAVNNGFFDFKFARDLHDKLRKQWAGMFFEFLSQRGMSNQLKSTNESITNLSIASKKIEQLVKSVYRQVDEAGANESISTIDAESEASKFFEEVSIKIDNDGFIPNGLVDELAKNTPKTWWEFLLELPGFDYFDDIMTDDNRLTSAVVHNLSESFISDIDGELSRQEKKTRDGLEYGYNLFLSLSEKSKKKLLAEYDDLSF